MIQNKVELLENNIIYVEKVGDQTAESMTDLFTKIKQYAASLRSERKPVFILSNASQEGSMDIPARKVAAEIGKELDYDKSATYGAAFYLQEVRKLMVEATKLEEKVANFKTKEEAIEWLLS